MHRPHALASDLLIDATVVSAVGGGDVVGKRNFAFRFTIASVHQIEHHWGQVPGSRIRSQVSRGHKSSWHLGGQLRFFVCKNSVGRRHLVLVLECVRDSTLTLALTTASRPTNHECWHRGDPLIWDLLPTPSNSSTSVASRKITGAAAVAAVLAPAAPPPVLANAAAAAVLAVAALPPVLALLPSHALVA